MTPTSDQITEKAIELVVKSATLQPQLNGRCEKATELIRSNRVLRQGYISPFIYYYVATSADYSDHTTATVAKPTPPYYKVTLDLAHGTPHTCQCEDYNQAVYHAQNHILEEKMFLKSSPRGAPVVNGKVVCKHILAALSIETARARLGLDPKAEAAEATARAVEREAKRAATTAAELEQEAKANGSGLQVERWQHARQRAEKLEEDAITKRQEADELKENDPLPIIQGPMQTGPWPGPRRYYPINYRPPSANHIPLT